MTWSQKSEGRCLLQRGLPSLSVGTCCQGNHSYNNHIISEFKLFGGSIAVEQPHVSGIVCQILSFRLVELKAGRLFKSRLDQE